MLKIEAILYSRVSTKMPSVYDDIVYWERRIESLERRLTNYTRRASWSSETVKAVEYLECCIEECEDELNTLYSEVDKLEWVYD